MVDILIMLGVITIFCVVAWFVLSQIDLPDPIRKIVLIVLVIVAGILAIGFLLSFKGSGLRGFHFSTVPHIDMVVSQDLAEVTSA